MSFRQEHPVLFSIGSVACICMAIFSSIFVMGKYSVESAKINAEKELRVTEIKEKETTARAEESAQFWQKLIPWGSYEDEGTKK